MEVIGELKVRGKCEVTGQRSRATRSPMQRLLLDSSPSQYLVTDPTRNSLMAPLLCLAMTMAKALTSSALPWGGRGEGGGGRKEGEEALRRIVRA